MAIIDVEYDPLQMVIDCYGNVEFDTSEYSHISLSAEQLYFIATKADEAIAKTTGDW